jgi:hypothetical protein
MGFRCGIADFIIMQRNVNAFTISLFFVTENEIKTYWHFITLLNVFDFKMIH